PFPRRWRAGLRWDTICCKRQRPLSALLNRLYETRRESGRELAPCFKLFRCAPNRLGLLRMYSLTSACPQRLGMKVASPLCDLAWRLIARWRLRWRLLRRWLLSRRLLCIRRGILLLRILFRVRRLRLCRRWLLWRLLLLLWQLLV